MGVAARERKTGPGPASARLAAPQRRCQAQPSPYYVFATDAAGHMRKLEEIEAELIRMAIARYDGRMSEVARRLGIGRSTLYRKLKELGLDMGGKVRPKHDSESQAASVEPASSGRLRIPSAER